MIAINIPYKSQWDVDAQKSIGDCGIVSVAMLAAWRGVMISPDDLLDKAGLPAGRLTYSFSELIRAGSTVGITLAYLKEVDWAAIKGQLQQGNPVIPLLDYEYLSGNLDTHFKGNHFWVNLGYNGDTVLVNDPDFWQPYREQGHLRQVKLSEFESSIKACGYQALFLV